MNHEEIIRRASPFTMTNPIRMEALFNSIQQIKGLEGDIVETGVCQGGSSILMAMTLKAEGVKHKKIYMYDTFEGMPEPSLVDNKPNRKWTGIEKWKREDKWNYASLDEVKKNIRKSDYPLDKFILTKGLVEETIPKVIPEKIALLRLDTDFYSSTKHALIHLFPRLVKGGVLIIDDYGAWEGCKQAVDEYFYKNMIDKRLIKVVDKSCREYTK
jgi:O-methyltransferase